LSAEPPLAELHVQRALRALGSQGGALRVARQARRLGNGRCAFARLPHRAGARAPNAVRLSGIPSTGVEPSTLIVAALVSRGGGYRATSLTWALLPSPPLHALIRGSICGSCLK